MNTEVKENNELKEYKEKIFDDIKHIDELGNEYWEARELMTALEYSKWEHFVKVINKAKISCNLSGVNVNDHFPVKGKIVKSGATTPTKNLNASESTVAITKKTLLNSVWCSQGTKYSL